MNGYCITKVQELKDIDAMDKLSGGRSEPSSEQENERPHDCCCSLRERRLMWMDVVYKIVQILITDLDAQHLKLKYICRGELSHRGCLLLTN